MTATGCDYSGSVYGRITIMKLYLFICLLVICLLTPAARASNLLRVGVFVRHLEAGDLNSLILSTGSSSRILELGVPWKPSPAEADRELKRLQFLADLLRVDGQVVEFRLFRLDHFDTDRPSRAPESVLPALRGSGCRFAIDLRTPQPPPAQYGDVQTRLDDTLHRLPDLFLVVPTGDAGRDDNQDGVADLNTAAGELAALKNVFTVGASENFNSSLPDHWQGFPVPPLSTDKVADSLSGLSADSGRGPENGRIPACVIPATALADGRGGYLRGSHYAAIQALGAAIRGDLFLRGTLGLPEIDRSLLTSYLLSRTLNLDPGQFGRGPFREITGCPDPGQGFGQLNPLDEPGETGRFFFFPERTGRMAGTAWRHDLPRVTRPTRAIAQLSSSDPGGWQILNDLDLEVRMPDGRVIQPERRSSLRSNEQVVFTLHPRKTAELVVRCRKSAEFRAPFSVTVHLLPLK